MGSLMIAYIYNSQPLELQLQEGAMFSAKSLFLHDCHPCPPGVAVYIRGVHPKFWRFTHGR